ncbi:hypothetical protein CLFO_25630 [Clostridium formicaceticum]|uniref:Uncharacterized protein n=1 Tax=Clostridium formicaceticum TaxID=1497 RepID=A0AAC9RM57_9CLOT|nr:hypothetical protein CLFO_25630 [Clostridium formicaceticum]
MLWTRFLKILKKTATEKISATALGKRKQMVTLNSYYSMILLHKFTVENQFSS